MCPLIFYLNGPAVFFTKTDSMTGVKLPGTIPLCKLVDSKLVKYKELGIRLICI